MLEEYHRTALMDKLKVCGWGKGSLLLSSIFLCYDTSALQQIADSTCF